MNTISIGSLNDLITTYAEQSSVIDLEDIIHCIKCNRIDMFDYLVTNYVFQSEEYYMHYFMIFAARYGHLSILEHIMKYHYNENILTEDQYSIIMDNSVIYGHLDTLIWLYDKRSINCSMWAIIQATQRGHLKIIKWLHQKGLGITAYIMIMDACCKNGHLGIVKWLHENNTTGCTISAMDQAAGNGHLDIVTFLHENRTEGCTTNAMNDAARNGFLDVVKWLHENRTEGCTTKAMDLAACNGHLDIVKWLHENRTEGCTTFTIDLAVCNGHFEIVKFLRENRTEGCTALAFDYATMNNSLDILKFLYVNYKHLVTKVHRETYEMLIPFLQADFRALFTRIEKEMIVKEFLCKKIVYHPSSCYIKRIVGRF